MAKILRYPDIVVEFNNNTKGLVQNVSVEGEAGLDLVIFSSGVQPIANNQNINVSVESLCSSIDDIAQMDFISSAGTISLSNSGENGASKLNINDCLLTEVDYSFESKGFFTQKLTFIGLSLGSDTSYTPPNFASQGRAPFRTSIVSGSYHSSAESINISQKINRSILYDIGNPRPYISVLELPITTTLSFNIICSGGSYDSLDVLSLLQSITGCAVSLDKNNINIKTCNSNITFSGCYLQNLSYDGGGIDGSPQKAIAEFISYDDYGLSSNRIIYYRQRSSPPSQEPEPEPE